MIMKQVGLTIKNSSTKGRKVLTSLAALLLATAGFAQTPLPLSSAQRSALSNLVVQVQATGVSDSALIYRALVSLPAVGTAVRTNVFARNARVVAVEQALITCYTNVGLASTASMENVADAYNNLSSPTAGQTKLFIRINAAWSELLRNGANPDSITGYATLTNLQTVAVFGDSLWTTNNPGINVYNVEAVSQKR